MASSREGLIVFCGHVFFTASKDKAVYDLKNDTTARKNRWKQIGFLIMHLRRQISSNSRVLALHVRTNGIDAHIFHKILLFFLFLCELRTNEMQQFGDMWINTVIKIKTSNFNVITSYALIQLYSDGGRVPSRND